MRPLVLTPTVVVKMRRVGAAPLCPICGAVRKSCEPGSHGDQGSMGGTPGPLGAGEASGVSPSRLRVVP